MNVLRVLLVAIIITTTFYSCKKDEPNFDLVLKFDSYPNVIDGFTLFGDINENITLAEGRTYYLAGGVHINPNVTLTIEKGVTIKSDAVEPSPAYLLIEPGAKILANGTATKPIVMTSGHNDPKVQDWGGLIICGKAPINTPTGTASSEMGAGVTYGGGDINDNSGVLSYVRVEYGGKKQNQTKEHNGITFEGVGAGTQVDHIAVYQCADDGIEFFGGSVSVKYAFVYGVSDDCFDWTYGWRGNGQFWVAQQGERNGDRGLEGDNNGNNNLATAYSDPRLSNITLVGSATIKNLDGNLTRAMKLREGTRGKIYNVVAYGFANGIEVQHDETLKNMSNGLLDIKGLYLSNPSAWAYNTNNGRIWNGRMPFELEQTNSTANTSKPSFITDEYIGTDANNAIDPTALGVWFTPAHYKGAVLSTNDWTKGWTRN